MNRSFSDLSPTLQHKAQQFMEESERKLCELLQEASQNQPDTPTQFADQQYSPSVPATNSAQASHWAKDAWDRAKQKQIVGENESPKETVTQEQLMVFFDRLELLDALENSTISVPSWNYNNYAQYVSDWAKLAWDKAKKKGLISDNSNPQDTVSQEELMVFFKRANMI